MEIDWSQLTYPHEISLGCGLQGIVGYDTDSLENEGIVYTGLKGDVTTGLPSERTRWKILGLQSTYPHEISSGYELQGITGLSTLKAKA